ncbi:MAG: hypothetical protein JWN27_2894 [Candidatus Eremiobacteraeota bacterium]|nr:hypothetical protein [Candidatus Eremiobacteraeota bacterium]
MSRTIPAVRQAVFSALTSTAFQYVINAGAPITIPVSSFRAGKQFVGSGTPPDPFVTIDVTDGGAVTQALPDRHVRIKVTASTAAVGGDDAVTEIIEVAIARLRSGPEGISLLSRAATGATLPATIREVRNAGGLPAAFEEQSQRWYASTEFTAIAI